FSHKEVSAAEAREVFANNPYKLELIEEIENGAVQTGEKITLYTIGEFTDLCRGGHVENPAKEIDPESFKLDRVAGAYWRGDEKNKMLTRIYGLAFETGAELASHIAMREEAKKRDHKKLGKELGLFIFSDLVGPGLPLWTPKGTIVRNLLDDYVWSLRREKGFMKVTIPHITKKDLYETSGHWGKYADGLFKITTRENHLYAMKPMNCPHHAQIFAATPKSYRDMPQRYSETTMVYRDEQSGELSGLSRVLSITQDDAHVFCRQSQIEQEVFAIWDIIDEFYGVFGFEDLKIRLSRHDPSHFEKYLGTPEIWKNSEAALTKLIEKRGIKEWVDGLGEAAIYGPKIDFIAKDSIGRTLQVATIQLDFNQPKNFGLTCTNEKGEKEDVVMIHCAIMGSIERFMSVLIEHYAGAFPFWLAPVQVAIVPVSEAHEEYSRQILEKIKAEKIDGAQIRAELFLADDSLGKRIREAKVQKIPYTLIIGDKEIANSDASEANLNATLENRDKGNLGALSVEEIIAKFRKEIEEKK
ncbi:MAG: threonine--tRNA ligase, partial [Patescibacteria group bacterium]